MAESNTTRLGLRTYTADTDTFSRAEYVQNVTAMEALTAIYKQGLFSARPAAGVQGTYYFATDSKVTYYDDGSAWNVVGSASTSATITSANSGSVALTAAGVSGQTANIFEAKVVAATKAFISAAGQISGNDFTGKKYNATGAANNETLYAGQTAASQSADVVSLLDSGGGTLFKVGNAGAISSAFFKSGPANTGGSVIGAASADTIANLTNFSGVPAFEVYSTRGGTGSTFTDGLYLKHQAADSTPVLRRWGILMRVGDEVSGDASKSAAMYLESSAASFGSPKLVLGLGNTAQMQFPATGSASIERDTQVNGRLVAAPGSGSAFGIGTAGEFGAQGTSTYERISNAAGTHYWYAGGTHSTTPGAPGSGGSFLASLKVANGVGHFETVDLIAQGTFQAGTGSTFTTISGNEIQANDSATDDTMVLNPNGGDIEVGDANTFMFVNGAFFIKGNRITMQAAAPTGAATSDVWIQNA